MHEVPKNVNFMRLFNSLEYIKVATYFLENLITTVSPVATTLSTIFTLFNRTKFVQLYAVLD